MTTLKQAWILRKRKLTFFERFIGLLSLVEIRWCYYITCTSRSFLRSLSFLLDPCRKNLVKYVAVSAEQRRWKHARNAKLGSMRMLTLIIFYTDYGHSFSFMIIHFHDLLHYVLQRFPLNGKHFLAISSYINWKFRLLWCQ